MVIDISHESLVLFFRHFTVFARSSATGFAAESTYPLHQIDKKHHNTIKDSNYWAFLGNAQV